MCTIAKRRVQEESSDLSKIQDELFMAREVSDKTATLLFNDIEGLDHQSLLQTLKVIAYQQDHHFKL